MKKTTLTFEETQAAEKAADDRRRSRKTGYAKMIERDEGMHQLSNGVMMYWHVNPEIAYPDVVFKIGEDSKGRPITARVMPPTIPEDSFGLEIDGKVHIFNLEDFRRSLRWA